MMEVIIVVQAAIIVYLAYQVHHLREGLEVFGATAVGLTHYLVVRGLTEDFEKFCRERGGDAKELLDTHT